jgi:hypothetical protein
LLLVLALLLLVLQHPVQQMEAELHKLQAPAPTDMKSTGYQQTAYA